MLICQFYLLLMLPNSAAINQIKALDSFWSEMKVEASSILAAQDTVLSLHDVASKLNETISQLQIEYDEVVEILLENQAPSDQVAMAQRQPWLAERMIRSVGMILEGGEDSIVAADSFDRDARLFGRVLTGMQDCNINLGISRVTDTEAVNRLREISGLFEFVNDSVDSILGNFTRNIPDTYSL